MSGAMLLYLLTVTLWLVLAAATADWLLVRLKKPSRWVWIVALALSVIIPLIPALPRAFSTLPAAIRTPAEQTVERITPSVPTSAPVAERAWVDTIFIPMHWFQSASIVTLGLLLAGWGILARRSRRWTPSSMDGTPVLLAPATGPAVVGFFRPKIVVPNWAFELPVEQRRMLLAHEQGHIDARDPLLLLAGGLVVVGAAWNPLAWYALHRLRGAIEIDCDRRVLNEGTDVEGYARCLVDSVTLAAGHRVPAIAALSWSTCNLERRVALMLHTSRPFKIVSAIVAVASIALATTAFMKAPPAPSAEDIAFAKANAAALELAAKRTANYYERLTSGKVASPAITYGVLYENWQVIDKNKKGEGC